jgi:rod shape-determining protein MreD
MRKIVRQALLALLLIALQILVFDNLQLRGVLSTYVSLSIYFFYLLILPIGMARTRLIIVAFALGFAIDIFSNMLGIHTAACVLVGFLRTHVLRMFNIGREKDKYIIPSTNTMGTLPFFYYTLILTFCFHFLLCSLEIFTFHKFYLTFVRIILSTLASTIIMMIFQALFVRGSKR